MTKIAYIDKKFTDATLGVIEEANVIIDEYEADGFKLTLRQLYYQFVARDLLPNTQRSYKRLGDIIRNARYAGLVSWEAIEDRTRYLRENSHWEKPEDILRAARSSFYMDKWEGQDCRVEVWIEKDALVGVIEDVCKDLDVPFFSCRGYVSSSEMWGAAQRLEEYENDGITPIILHLGDHDPSGVDMSRDMQGRLDEFGLEFAEVRRIALSMDQVRELNPPPNPAKLSDSRARGYIRRFGYESWELDALEPRYMENLIRDEVEALRDDEIMEAVLAEETEHHKTLDRFIEQAK